jgi:hypothetical protein
MNAFLLNGASGDKGEGSKLKAQSSKLKKSSKLKQQVTHLPERHHFSAPWRLGVLSFEL